MTRLFELINSTEWDDVRQVLLSSGLSGEEQIEGYMWMFHHLREEKTPSADESSTLISLTTHPDEEGNPYIHVDGIKPGEEDDIGYALEYQPWEEWLGMGFEPGVLDQYSPQEIVANCLWEMSWVSFDEAKIKAQFDLIMSETTDAMENLEEGDDYESVD